jgi:hypothetical protein
VLRTRNPPPPPRNRKKNNSLNIQSSISTTPQTNIGMMMFKAFHRTFISVAVALTFTPCSLMLFSHGTRLSDYSV